MLGEHIEAALGGPLTGAALDEIARTIWRALGEGVIDWAEAERLDGLVHARRARMRGAGGSGGGGGAGGLQRASAALHGLVRAVARHRPRCPDRAVLRDRRLGVVLSGAVPTAVARGHRFTPGQVAVLSVVGREAARGEPSCEWPIAKIAALAGVGRTTVREALRAAARVGLVRVRERRWPGARSETNVVTVEDEGWWRWLTRRPWQGGRDDEGDAEGPGEAPDEATAAAESQAAGGAGGGGSETPTPMSTEDLRRGERGAEGRAGAPGEGVEGPRRGASPRPGSESGSGGPRDGPVGGG